MPATTAPDLPKVQQVLHVRSKSILSCTFARSAASSRSGVAPPPSYQSVTVGGITTLLHLNSRDGIVRNVGSIQWEISEGSRAKKQTPAHKVTIGDHSRGLLDVLQAGKGITKDLKFKSDTRAVRLPGADSALYFQRVAVPSGGFPYTVYTIMDGSLPPGPTPAHTCVAQLTVRQLTKHHFLIVDRPTTGRFLSLFGVDNVTSEQAYRRQGTAVRLEIRTRDKALTDRIVFASLLVIANRHPTNADSRVESDRAAASEENEWDAPPALSNLATPSLTPNPSDEHLPTHELPMYDYESRDPLLFPQDDVSSQHGDASDETVPGPSTERPVIAA